MRLQFIAALVLGLSAAPSYASCEEGVVSALQNFWQSGPFYFNRQEWNNNFIRQTAGVIVPDEMAQYTKLRVQDGHNGSQTIYKDKQSWENDGYGWVGPYSTFWSFSVGVPKSDLSPIRIACVEQPVYKENQFVKYNFYVQPFSSTEVDTSVKHTIHVGTAENLIIRYEREGNESSSINEISTFRFNNNLTVEIPNVDMENRRQRLIRRYDEEVAESNADCGSDVTSILDRVRSVYSFEYEIRGQLWSGVSGIKGTFVPPNSINYFVEGVPYHGGDTEYRLIGDKQWYRSKGDNWFGPVNSSRNNEYGFLSIGQATLPHDPQLGNFHVGAVKCSKSNASIDDKHSNNYSFDVFVDTDTGRTKGINVKMHLDSKADLPVKFEMRRNELSPVVLTETRHYRKNIEISEPVVIKKNYGLVPKLIPLVVPLDLAQ